MCACACLCMCVYACVCVCIRLLFSRIHSKQSEDDVSSRFQFAFPRTGDEAQCLSGVHKALDPVQHWREKLVSICSFLPVSCGRSFQVCVSHLPSLEKHFSKSCKFYPSCLLSGYWVESLYSLGTNPFWMYPLNVLSHDDGELWSTSWLGK